jgi:tetratricopeptide (TPR) repeat protein
MKNAGSKKPISKTKGKLAAKPLPASAKRSISTSRASTKAMHRKASVHPADTRTKGNHNQPPPVLKREPTAEELLHRKNMARFENAVKVFNGGDFGKALELFEPLAAIPSQDLAQRVRIYVNICQQRLSKPVLRLKTADDFYNYAVSMANQGNREEAENNLNKALKLAPRSDYIYYALATTQALRENVEGALENLQKAIELNAKNRYLAQNDADFDGLGEDPRFTELIYPERP